MMIIEVQNTIALENCAEQGLVFLKKLHFNESIVIVVYT